MQNINIITVGTFKEKYFREAAEEYRRRLSGSCRFTEVELKDEKLPHDPSRAQIDAALEKEASRIIDAIPGRSYVVAMCIEGKQFSSEELAAKLEDTAVKGYSSVTFIIGSSYGMSDRVKSLADLKLSMSRLTFPHKLARVMLLEAVYRAGGISSGSKYHK